MNRTYRLRVYVGPTCVAPLAEQFASALSGAGLPVVLTEGTAHLYVQFPSESMHEWCIRGEFLQFLRDRLNTTFCLTPRDVEVLGGAN